MHTYNPGEVSIIVGSRPLHGVADGTFVKIDRANDAFTMKEGADGEVTRTKTNSKSGSIEVTLEQASTDNDYLSTLANTDELTGEGTIPVMIRDAKGTTICISPAAWIKKMPSTEFGKESGQRAWMLDCAILEMFVGGN